MSLVCSVCLWCRNREGEAIGWWVMSTKCHSWTHLLRSLFTSVNSKAASPSTGKGFRQDFRIQQWNRPATKTFIWQFSLFKSKCYVGTVRCGWRFAREKHVLENLAQYYSNLVLASLVRLEEVLASRAHSRPPLFPGQAWSKAPQLPRAIEKWGVSGHSLAHYMLGWGRTQRWGGAVQQLPLVCVSWSAEGSFAEDGRERHCFLFLKHFPVDPSVSLGAAQMLDSSGGLFIWGR